MNCGDDRCARDGCGKDRNNSDHWNLTWAGHHAFIEPQPIQRGEEMGTTVAEDCNDCEEDSSFRCDVCGADFCGEHAAKHKHEADPDAMVPTFGSGHAGFRSSTEVLGTFTIPGAVSADCRAPTWCGTNCLGPIGPGFNSVLDVDYVRGWNCELFCSTACRDRMWPGKFPQPHPDAAVRAIADDIYRRLWNGNHDPIVQHAFLPAAVIAGRALGRDEGAREERERERLSRTCVWDPYTTGRGNMLCKACRWSRDRGPFVHVDKGTPDASADVDTNSAPAGGENAGTTCSACKGNGGFTPFGVPMEGQTNPAYQCGACPGEGDEVNTHKRWAEKMMRPEGPTVTALERAGAERERRRIRRLIAPVLIGLRKSLELEAVEWLDMATRAPRRRK